METWKGPTGRNQWLLIFGIHTIIGILFFSTIHTSHLVKNEDTPFYYPLIDEMTGSYAGFILLPVVLWFFGRVPITKRNSIKTVPLYILASMLFGICHTLLMVYSRKIIYGFLFDDHYLSELCFESNRYCGKIFCTNCSSRKIPLPKIGYATPVRVCDDCMEEIKSGNEWWS